MDQDEERTTDPMSQQQDEDGATPESASDQSASDESASDESASDESASDESATDESATDESAQDDAAQREASLDPDAPSGHADAPVKPSVALPKLGLRGTLLFLWRQLTSMQTALILLMLLAIAAVPGSLYPQRNVNSSQTQAYLDEHGKYAEILDKLGMFDVYSSPWFSAIYLLLFISLIGCVIPRLLVHLRHMREKPPRTPSRLTRFVGHTRIEVPGADADALVERARKDLRRRRYRTVVQEEKGARAVSSERGYLRETGNLIFHIALLGVLIGVAGGHLTQYRGQITVIEGEGFANSLAQYDSFDAGAWFDEDDLPDFQLTLDEFRAEYSTSTNEHQFGQPTSFEADVTVTTPTTGTDEETVQVNKPLSLPGADMFLLGNGYAPEITVRDADGTVVAEGAVITIPSGDMGYTSSLVLKMPDAEPEQMAVVGYFLPTGVIDDQGPHSEYPALIDPQLALTVYTGDLGLDDGVPQNAYQIDVSTLTAVTGDEGSPILIRLYPGEEYELADGSTISFDGVKRYAAFDIKHDPFQTFTLVMALSATGGLILSLFVPRRRVWVRVKKSADGAILEVAGLARSEDPRLEEDVRDLAARLTDTAPEAPTSRSSTS